MSTNSFLIVASLYIALVMLLKSVFTLLNHLDLMRDTRYVSKVKSFERRLFSNSYILIVKYFSLEGNLYTTQVMVLVVNLSSRHVLMYKNLLDEPF